MTKKYEMDRTCSTYGGEKKYVQRFCEEIVWEGVEFMKVVQDREKLLAVVKL